MAREQNDGDDGPIMVNWKTLPIVIAFVAVLILATTGSSAQQALTIKVSVGVCLGVWVLFLLKLLRKGVFRRNPANEIARLVASGKNEEAYSKGMAVLQDNPDDPVVQLNCVAAMYQSGRAQEARDLCARIRRNELPRFMQSAYDEWRRKVMS